MSLLMILFVAALLITGLSVLFYNAIEMEETSEKDHVRKSANGSRRF